MFEINPAVQFTRADMDPEPQKLSKLDGLKALYRKDQMPGIFTTTAWG